MIKFPDFKLNDRILDIFLKSYSKSLNMVKTLIDFDDSGREFYLAQPWYLCSTIQLITGIKEEYLHDPGTEWIWEFVNNKEIVISQAGNLNGWMK